LWTATSGLIGNPSQISLQVRGLIITAREILESCFNPGMDEVEKGIEANLENEPDFKVSPPWSFVYTRETY